MDVLLVAAKKEEIGDLTNFALEAKLRPRVVDLDAFTDSELLRDRVRRAAAGPDHRAAARRRVADHDQHPVAGHDRVHARHRQRRQRDHRRDPAPARRQPGRGRGLQVRHRRRAWCRRRCRTSCATWSRRSPARSSARSTSTWPPAATARSTASYVSGGTANVQALHDEIAQRCQVDVVPLDPLLVAQPDPKTVDPVALQGRTVAGRRRVRPGAAQGPGAAAVMIRINLLPEAKRQAVRRRQQPALGGRLPARVLRVGRGAVPRLLEPQQRARRAAGARTRSCSRRSIAPRRRAKTSARSRASSRRASNSRTWSAAADRAPGPGAHADGAAARS